MGQTPVLKAEPIQELLSLGARSISLLEQRRE
jgi:hypothetical protein